VGSSGRSLAARGVVVGLAVVGLLATTPASGAPQPLNVDASGTNGAGRITRPGRACAEGGDGAHWHYEYDTELAPGVFSQLESDLGLHLDAHSDLDHGQPGGWLAGEESYATIANQRGTLKLRMQDGGSCGAPTATLTPEHVATAGSWAVEEGTGSYEGTTGSGTFAVDAGIAPGADNPWNLDLAGNVSVLLPSLDATVVSTHWGNLGTDYLNRTVSVLVRLTNNGPGDSFGARLTAANPINPGVTLRTGMPIPLGDLAAGESEDVVVRYQFNLLTGPCTLIILGCQFDARFTVSMPDALDVAASYQDVARVTAPNLPPPL
jgi:hypothetical protein